MDKFKNYDKKQIKTQETFLEKDEKQLLRVKTPYDKNIYDHYNPSSFYTTTVSSPANGREQCSLFSHCREHVIASVRAALSEVSEYDNIYFTDRTTGGPAVDMQKIRLLVTLAGIDTGQGKINKAWKELFFAKKVLNTYEKFLGMEKSTVSTVKLEHKEGLSTAWLFTGSSEWILNPVMFSIYIMIIRASKNTASTIGTIDTPTMPKLNKHWKKFYNYVGKKNKDTFMSTSYSKILEVLLHRHALFTKSPINSYFASNGSSDFSYYKKVGIVSLLDKTHLDEDLIKKAEKLKIV